MSHTFAVDDVAPAKKRLPTRRLGDRFTGTLAIGGDPELATIEIEGIHPLMAAVHHAFSEHRPLVLSPDAIWLTIAQGIAHHIRLNADRLRDRLVRHEGRKRIEIQLSGDFPSDAAGIGAVIGQMRTALAGEVGAGRARLLTCDFSTTGEVERVASEIVLLDAYSPYFDFFAACICGIPEITLTGTPDDWRVIRKRIDLLGELELASWAASLAPICDRLVAAAEGKPDAAFFRRIYKPKRAYGWDRVTGWITRFWPYIGYTGAFSVPNPMLELELDWDAKLPEKGLLAKAKEAITGPDFFDGPGIRTHDVPAGPSSCLFHLVHTVTRARLPDVILEGGLMAVEQDSGGRLIPRAGFVARVSEGSIGEAIDEIRAKHAATARRPRTADAAASGDAIVSGVAGTVRFHDLVDGVTVESRADEVTGLESRVVMAFAKDAPRRPRIDVGLERHALAPEMILVVADGAAVKAGDVLARFAPAPALGFDEGPAELNAIDDVVDDATFFGWRILPKRERTSIAIALGDERIADVERIVDLPDGTFLGYTEGEGGLCWVRMRKDALRAPGAVQWRSRSWSSSESADAIPVVGRRLAGVLLRALRNGGATDLPADAMLQAVLPDWLRRPLPKR